MKKFWFIIVWLLTEIPGGYAQQTPAEISIRITDEQHNPIFGVYMIHKKQFALLTSTDIDGECVLPSNLVPDQDTIIFQGMGYETIEIRFGEIKQYPTVCLKELKYDLPEAVAQGSTPEELLKKAIGKLKKEKGGRLPVCRYSGVAQYEKLTLCRDTVVEYRREYGHYFTSGDIKTRNTWDQTYRSYLVPEYMARSYNLTNDGCDTLTPMSLTYEDIRFDVGTRKIFTLIRAIQLYGPLFSGTHHYDIRAVDTEDPDYTFTFKTRSSSYPDLTRISCKGTFVLDRETHLLKSMSFDYIDYQLLRQVLLTNQRKTNSPFSTRATLTFAYDSSGRYYVRSCDQTTTWKFNLGSNFILIEQPTRHQPAENRLIEKEAFYCFDYQTIPSSQQNNHLLVKIHLAQRYPTGIYNPEIFQQLPPLLPTKQAYRDLGRYMPLQDQFRANNGKPYYPDNYILNSDIDKRSRKIYHTNLRETQKQLFELFGHVPIPMK